MSNESGVVKIAPSATCAQVHRGSVDDPVLLVGKFEFREAFHDLSTQAAAVEFFVAALGAQIVRRGHNLAGDVDAHIHPSIVEVKELGTYLIIRDLVYGDLE